MKLTVGTLRLPPGPGRSLGLTVARRFLYGRQLLEVSVARAEEDVTLVLEEPVHAGVHQLVVLETG